MLGHLALQLHPDKPRVLKAKGGFDFRGVHFHYRETGGIATDAYSHCTEVLLY